MMAAAVSTRMAVMTSKAPMAASEPTAKSRESPGRKGVTTRPVSQKTMTNRITYTQIP